MLSNIQTDYRHTIYASHIGYITQAIVNNFAPLLFITFVSAYGLGLKQITLITTVNFFVQLCVDLLSAKFIDKIGYRVSIVAAHIFAAVGLFGLAAFPSIMGNVYAGLMTAVVLYAIGGGIIEVLISPIVESCPTERKEAAMSLLHSFYCWGQVFLVVISTLYFQTFGTEGWKVLAGLWALIPLFNAVYFCKVPLYPVTGTHEKISFSGLIRQKIFWLLILIMICAGASELAMSQWASAFAETALKVSKTVGDLAGPCAFGIFMGTARALYGKFSEKIPLEKFMTASAILCILCYGITVFAKNPFLGLACCGICGFSVGIFWPGTFSIAAKKLPGGGTAMYALMALAGDIGCSAGPTVVGMTANAAGGNLKAGLGAAMIFPILILMFYFILQKD